MRAPPPRRDALDARLVEDPTGLGVHARERAGRDPGHRQRRQVPSLRSHLREHLPLPRRGRHLGGDRQGTAHLRVWQQRRAHRHRKDVLAGHHEQDPVQPRPRPVLGGPAALPDNLHSQHTIRPGRQRGRLHRSRVHRRRHRRRRRRRRHVHHRLQQPPAEGRERCGHVRVVPAEVRAQGLRAVGGDVT